MTAIAFTVFIARFWRGILWALAWMTAFWLPAFVPIVGWLAPLLLAWMGIQAHRRRQRREPTRCVICPPVTQRPKHALPEKRQLGVSRLS